MRENRLDSITDKLRLRVDRILGNARRQFKNVNPYRQEPVPDEQRIESYLKWANTPMEQELRAQFGDAEVDKIHYSMHELINRRQLNA